MPQKINWPTAQYTLTERSYISRVPGGPHELLEPGTVITHNGKPGPHMEAMDSAGEWAHEQAGEQSLDFTRKLDMMINTETGETNLKLAPKDGPAGDFTPHPGPKASDMVRTAPPANQHIPPGVMPPPPPPLPPPSE